MLIALFYWSFIQSFLLGLTILIYRNNRSNRILAAFFFVESCVILFQYLLKYELWLFDLPATLFIPDILNISIGPILFLYSHQLVYGNWTNKNLLHFIPPIALFGYFLFFEVIPQEHFEYFHYINTTAHIVVLSLILLSNLVYLFLFWANYKKCHKLHEKKSYNVKPWLQILFIFFVIQLFINMVIWILHFNLNQINEEYLARDGAIKDLIFISLNAIIVFTTGFFIVVKPEIVTSLGTKITNRLKSKTFIIETNDAQMYIARLEKLMDEEKVYLDPQLNEKLLAEKLNIQPYYLSKLMNEHMKCSFNEFINRARIEETKRLLESDKTRDLTLFAIAVDSGFSSESVFYSNFKKFVGITPNQYKKKVAGKT
jgi:AraC-like DNA-binding protein